MTIEEAKNIRLTDYLHSLGYAPVKQQGANLWYKSPFREENEASFKVNAEINKWYDFGLGKGGNIIALASELYCSVHVPYLLQRIAEQTPHIRPVSFSFREQSSTAPNFQRMEIKELTSPALLFYLQERRINLELAKRECCEVHFENNGKRYFAIGFQIWLTVTRYATDTLKAVSRRRISPILGMKAEEMIPVSYSRDSWTISRS